MNNEPQAPQTPQSRQEQAAQQIVAQPSTTSPLNSSTPVVNHKTPRKWPLTTEIPKYFIIMAVIFPVGIMTSTLIENMVSESTSTIIDLVLMLYFVLLMIIGTIYIRNYRKKYT